MAFVGIFLALGTLATLGYAGYTLYLERQKEVKPAVPALPFLPKVATDIQETITQTGQSNRIFEAYIADKFNREEYRLMHWRRDKKTEKTSEKLLPTLTFQLVENSSIQFSIECQYSPSFSSTNAIAILPQQVDVYYTYQKENNRIVFVILGVGGTPEKPERLYVVPLNDIPREQEYLPASYLSRYRKLDIKSNFFLLPERMMLI